MDADGDDVVVEMDMYMKRLMQKSSKQALGIDVMIIVTSVSVAMRRTTCSNINMIDGNTLLCFVQHMHCKRHHDADALQLIELFAI